MPKIDIPEDVMKVFHILDRNCHKAFLVGGLVRDSIIGVQGKDFDLATSAHPDQVQALFSTFAIPTGLKHGTVTVMTEKGTPVEVTTFRGDGTYSDGRRPDDVRFVTTIEEDLSRRDFTMNAIAFDPMRDRIVDPFRGQRDIAMRIVRTVGPPELRFNEDGLRVMRAIRFSCRLGFDIEHGTFWAIRKAHDTFRKVSSERVRDELLKILGSRNPAGGIDLLLASGLLDIILPELTLGVGMVQNKFHAHDVFGHTLEALRAAKGDEIFKLAVLLHDVGKPKVRAPHPKRAGEFQFLKHELVGADIARDVCERLKLSNEQTERVVFIVRHHMELHQVNPTWNNATLRKFANRLGKDRLPDLFAMTKADVKGMTEDQQRIDKTSAIEQRVAEANKEASAFSIKDLAINGQDVMRLCELKPGEAVGNKLKSLFAMVVEDPTLNNRETLERLAKEVP